MPQAILGSKMQSIKGSGYGQNGAPQPSSVTLDKSKDLSVLKATPDDPVRDLITDRGGIGFQKRVVSATPFASALGMKQSPNKPGEKVPGSLPGEMNAFEPAGDKNVTVKPTKSRALDPSSTQIASKLAKHL